MSLTVLQIIPALGGGGAEQACAEITAGLVERGDKALVVSSGGVRVADVEAAGGVHYLHDVATKNPVKIIANAKWLAQLIREQHVDIVHARSRAPAWSAWLACRSTSCHYVTTFHAVYKFGNPLKKYYNRVMTRADRIIAISRYVANHIHTAYGVSPKRIATIYRGIDVDKYVPAKITPEQKQALCEAWNVTAEDRLVLLPGRLSPIKGHGLAIKALALLPADLADVKLVIVGDVQGRVAYRQELEKMAADLNVTDRVRFVPHCSDMPAAYAMAALVLMTSKVPEGFGRVPVEAMAMGVPVIASSLGPTAETVIEGETGWLLPPEDPVQWTEAMAKALRMEPETRAKMAEVARALVAEKFTRSKMVQGTLAVYDEVCRERV